MAAFTIALWTPSPTSFVNVIETSTNPAGAQSLGVFADRQSADDATDGGAPFGPLSIGEAVIDHDVADAEPTAWSEDTKRLGEHGGLVG